MPTRCCSRDGRDVPAASVNSVRTPADTERLRYDLPVHARPPTCFEHVRLRDEHTNVRRIPDCRRGHRTSTSCFLPSTASTGRCAQRLTDRHGASSRTSALPSTTFGSLMATWLLVGQADTKPPCTRPCPCGPSRRGRELHDGSPCRSSIGRPHRALLMARCVWVASLRVYRARASCSTNRRHPDLCGPNLEASQLRAYFCSDACASALSIATTCSSRACSSRLPARRRRSSARCATCGGVLRDVPALRPWPRQLRHAILTGREPRNSDSARSRPARERARQRAR